MTDNIDLEEIAAIRRLLTEKPRPVGWAERRGRLDEIGAHWPPAPDIHFTGADMGGLLGEWSIAPGSDERKLLIFFHGGGYCSGSLRSHRRLVSEAGRAMGVRTLAVDYRRAPEHRLPAAYEDALTAWRFARAHGYAAADIVVGGDSAGGGITLALMGLLKAHGEAQPGCAWLISPWTDLTQSGDTMDSKDGEDPIIHRPYLQELVAACLPGDIEPADPRVSPLFADLSGLPPLLIQVGAAETLLADSTRLAEKAGAQEVAVTLEIWPHMIHAWPMWNAGLDAGRRALASAGAFARSRLTAPQG